MNTKIKQAIEDNYETEESNGVFTQSQEDLAKEAWEVLRGLK